MDASRVWMHVIAAAMMLAICLGDDKAGSPRFPDAVGSLMGGRKTDAQLVEAFAADGYHITGWKLFNSSRGVEAESNTVTLAKNGKKKKVYYVEGDGYSMGHLFGSLTQKEAEIMVTTYYERSVEGFFGPSLELKFGNSTLFRQAMAIVTDFVTYEAYQHWKNAYEEGIYPEELVEEMHGLADGCKDVNPRTTVTFERVIALTTLFDYLLANVYAGVWVNLLQTELPRRYHLSPALVAALMKMTEEDIIVYDHCNAFSARHKATVSNNDVFFGRDLQFPNRGVFQLYNTMTVYNPSDGRIPFVAVNAPSMVGIITGMNAMGVGVGLNLLRSSASNPQRPGFSGGLLIRHVMDRATSTLEAERLVGDAMRGTPYLYPIADRRGISVVIEAGKWTNTRENPLKYAQNQLLEYLPGNTALELATPLWLSNKGAFSRWSTYQYPEHFLDFNDKLLARKNVTSLPEMWGERGYLAGNYSDDEQLSKKLMNNYFTPQRETFDDVVLVSNFALLPYMRVTQMSLTADLMTLNAESIQWRYDELNRQIQDRHGTIDFSEAKDILTYLSPDRTPGYWKEGMLDKKDPMTAEIQGALTVMDLRRRYLETKAGYWCDDWMRITLGRYVGVPMDAEFIAAETEDKMGTQ